MKIYIAGPMSGIPQFNFPAFLAAGECLKEQGIDVLNPAEMDLEEDATSALASEDGMFDEDGTTSGKTWGDVLARDVKIVADDCDEVCLLPGWETSRGARLEAFIAINCNKRVSVMEDSTRVYYDVRDFMRIINDNTLNQGDVSRYGG